LEFVWQVYSLGDGPAQSIWKIMRSPVNIIQISHKMEIAVDWLKYAWHSTAFQKHDELLNMPSFVFEINQACFVSLDLDAFGCI
jgi:hypothetical protein